MLIRSAMEETGMKRLFGLTGMAAGAVLLAACGTQLESARMVTPAGSAFDNALYAEYIELSQFEYAEADYSDSDFYALRAMSAAAGDRVDPTALDARRLPAGTEGPIADARQRLVAALDGNARSSSPQHAARAQAMFDCWMEQQEEGHQPDHIAHCRNEFEAAMAQLRPAAPAAPTLDPRVSRVYFGHDSSALDAQAMSTIGAAAREFRADNFRQIALYGYTDTSGSSDYNQRLSERRSNAVRDALVAAGVPANAIRTSARGQYSLPRPTDDGVREPENRLVIIRLMP